MKSILLLPLLLVVLGLVWTDGSRAGPDTAGTAPSPASAAPLPPADTVYPANIAPPAGEPPAP